LPLRQGDGPRLVSGVAKPGGFGPISGSGVAMVDAAKSVVNSRAITQTGDPTGMVHTTAPLFTFGVEYDSCQRYLLECTQRAGAQPQLKTLHRRRVAAFKRLNE
jgi:hypothetical protein